ncbi:MAG TPA: acyl-CoA dehydrogenase family protein [Solirubrobacteraceae bacterium]
MNLALSDEQVFLQEAARGALGRVNTVAAAREALDGGELPDLWPTAREAGWSGLLVSDEHGGAGLGPFEAMLVMTECGRRLAPVPLLGHLPATALLDRSGEHPKLLNALAEGESRAAYIPARPPDSQQDGWTVETLRGAHRDPAPRFVAGKQEGGPHPIDGTVTGAVHWVPDLPGADAVVIVAEGDEGPVALLADVAGTDGVRIEPVMRYDATRSLGHLTLEEAPVTKLTLETDDLANAWYLAQALLAAEALGAVEEALERSVEYAKERFTFGRPIGSYQSVKHALVEILRRKENLLSLVYYAGWAGEAKPDELPMAASAARTVADGALDFAARELVSVHGGIGATWEHDAPLFFRRAQLSKRLLGGSGDSADRVADQLLTAAGALA